MKHVAVFFMMFFSSMLLLAGNVYKVNTDNRLNVRTGPGTSYSIQEQLQPGSIVYLLEEYENGWAKVSFSGKTGFVSKKFITEDTTVRKERKKSFTGFKNLSFSADWFLYGILILVILNFVFMLFDAGLLQLLILFLLPIFVILYVHLSPNPMWYCSPSKVGWIWTCVNVFLTVFVLSISWNIFKESFLDLFRGEFGLYSLFVTLLYGYAVYLMVSTAIMELLIVGIIMICGAGGGSSFVGTFTDRDGNKWDVYRD
ncbi:SH3 domain-containing protein [Bacteroides caecigallinarum]|nr:SH3 domain-containing protein [Bacteroides caecigallinarum]